MKIRKMVKVLAIVVVAVIVLVVLFLAFFLDSTIRTAVVTVLPKITGTKVELESVNLSIFSGRGTIKGLAIGNPEGFKTERAFYIGRATLDLDVWSLLTDRIIINEILIDAPEVTCEFGGSGTNIGKIQDNVDKFAGPPKEPAEKKPGKKIQINHFLVTNGKIGLSAKILQGKGVIVPLPTVEMKDIGKDSGGKSVGEVAKDVFGSVTDAINGAVNQAKKGLGAAGDALRSVLDSGSKGVSGAVDTIKGIFK